MNKEHDEALANEAREIDRLLVQPKDDSLEREKLVAAVSLGQRVAEHLQSEVADDGTWVDTGCDGHGYECFVTLKGREFQVYVSPGSTSAELDTEMTEMSESAKAWDALVPRVLSALRVFGDNQLTAEFAAQVGRHPDGRKLNED